MDKQDLIKEYITNSNGAIFHIDSIVNIRDGGTKLIKIDNHQLKRSYYIHKDNFTLHDNYPVSDDNLITDLPLKTYILDRITTYSNNLDFESKRNRNLLKNLGIENKSDTMESLFSEIVEQMDGKCDEKGDSVYIPHILAGKIRNFTKAQ